MGNFGILNSLNTSLRVTFGNVKNFASALFFTLSMVGCTPDKVDIADAQAAFLAGVVTPYDTSDAASVGVTSYSNSSQGSNYSNGLPNSSTSYIQLPGNDNHDNVTSLVDDPGTDPVASPETITSFNATVASIAPDKVVPLPLIETVSNEGKGANVVLIEGNKLMPVNEGTIHHNDAGSVTHHNPSNHNIPHSGHNGHNGPAQSHSQNVFEALNIAIIAGHEGPVAAIKTDLEELAVEGYYGTKAKGITKTTSVAAGAALGGGIDWEGKVYGLGAANASISTKYQQGSAQGKLTIGVGDELILENGVVMVPSAFAANKITFDPTNKHPLSFAQVLQLSPEKFNASILFGMPISDRLSAATAVYTVVEIKADRLIGEVVDGPRATAGLTVGGSYGFFNNRVFLTGNASFNQSGDLSAQTGITITPHRSKATN